jgi:hypothetical protein
MRMSYELYSDEHYHHIPGKRYLMLGGVVCTANRGEKLVRNLSQVRTAFNLTEEMHWGKVSNRHLSAYKAWVDVFLKDDLARFSLFIIDMSGSAWNNFNPRPSRTANQDERLASAYYQFLLVSFGGIFDTVSWEVYPDKGFFSRDTVVDRVGFLLNRTYKKALGSKTPRIIHRIGAYDSKRVELIQLADVLLASLSYIVISSSGLTSEAKLALVEHCMTGIKQNPKDKYGRDRLVVKHWVLPEDFRYH